MYAAIVEKFIRNTGLGAATSVLVATSPLLDGIGGRYFEHCNEAEANQPGARPVSPRTRSIPRPPPAWQVSIDTLAAS